MINSYDDGDDIVLDLAVYRDHTILWSLFMEQLTRPWDYPPIPKSTPRRFRLCNVSSKPVLGQAVTSFHAPESKCMELPVVNPAHYHKRYRYAYGVSIAGGKEAVISDQLIKLDMDHPEVSSPDILHDGSTKIWREKDCVPGEPIFVQSPDATEEDDGVILTIVLDARSVKSSLLVLDAKDLKEIARAEMDIMFPSGYHGVFVG
jgi:torulene dioxygenase